MLFAQGANVYTRECAVAWKDAINAYLNVRFDQNIRKSAGSLPFFAQVPIKHLHDEGLSMFLLHYHLINTPSDNSGSDGTIWEAAIRLVTLGISPSQSDNSGPHSSSNNFLPAAYLLFRLFGPISAIMRTVFDSNKSDLEIRDDLTVKKTHRWPEVAPISMHVLSRLLQVMCARLDADLQSTFRVSRYEFLPSAFYDSICDLSRFPTEKQSVQVEKHRIVRMLHEWVLAPGILFHESSLVCSVLVQSFSLRTLAPMLSESTSQLARKTLWWTRVPFILPSVFQLAQVSDPSIRLMNYLACSIYLRFHGGYEKLHSPNVRSHVPSAVSSLIEQSDAYLYPKMLQANADTSDIAARISVNLPCQMKTLLNVFSRTMQKYVAFHSHFAAGCTIPPEQLNWRPLRSISVQIFRILLLFYQTEISGNKQASTDSSTHKGTWRLAAIFLSNLCAANKAWDVAENPLVCSSMYFSLVALMHSHAKGRTQAIIKYRGVVQHMASIVLKRKTDGSTAHTSVLADVYAHVRDSLETTDKGAVTRSRNITMLFGYLVLRMFQYRSVDLWAKSIYVFANQQSVFEHVELKRVFSSNGTAQLSATLSSMSLYALGSTIFNSVDVTRVGIAGLFRHLCVKSLTMNSHSRTNQAPVDFFWTQTTFQRLVAYIHKVYLWGLCPSSVVQDNSHLPMSRMGIPDSSDFQAIFLHHKPRFLSFPFPLSGAQTEEERNRSWMKALIALGRLNQLTAAHNQARRSFESAMTSLLVLLCAGRVDLAERNAQTILESLGRPVTFNDRLSCSKPNITLMDFCKSSASKFPQTLREALPCTTAVKTYHIMDPFIIYCAITNNYIFIIQEILLTACGLCGDAMIEKGREGMCYIASDQFWRAMNPRKTRHPGSFLMLMKILLCMLRSLPKGQYISRFSTSSVQSPEGADFSKSYLLRFAHTVVRYITSHSGIEVYSMEFVRTHLMRVLDALPCQGVSREVYMKTNSVDFHHSFVLIDTVNLVRPVDLKIFLEALSRSTNATRSVTVLIPSTFLIEYFFVAQYSLKNSLSETSRTMEELFSFVLQALTDLSTIPNVFLLVLSPEAEYDLRIPIEAVRLHSVVKSEVRDNFLYRLETDHVLTAVGAGLHRLLEDLMATTAKAADKKCIDQRQFTDSWEVLVVSDDKLSASIASCNELRCTDIYLHAQAEQKMRVHEHKM